MFEKIFNLFLQAIFIIFCHKKCKFHWSKNYERSVSVMENQKKTFFILYFIVKIPFLSKIINFCEIFGRGLNFWCGKCAKDGDNRDKQ